MSRALPAFSRQSYDPEDYEYDRREELSPLIKQFAKNHIPTIVDATRARNANSIVQQVNSILGGKSRYATVADAVQDMTERTGLKTYLETIKSAEKEQSNVNKQANNEIYQLGFNDGKEDLENDQVGDMRAAMIHHHFIDKIKHDPLSYIAGYIKGSDYINNVKQHPEPSKRVDGESALGYEMNIINKIIREYGSFAEYINHLNKIHGKKQASESNYKSQIPSTLTQYDFADKVVNYIKNNIKNSNALSVTVPQLQADILAIFGVQGLQPQDVMNDEFVKYLSDCIFEAQKSLPPVHHNSNIGIGVGKDLEDSNDAWSGLMPAK